MRDDKSLAATDTEVGVSLCGFLGTVALFFAGLLISQFNSFSSTIRIPILFLIICTFAFIFSGVVYANAAGVLSRGEPKLAARFMSAGNAISEYLGIYLFVMAIPLVINAVTNDSFLRNSTGVITITSLLLYSGSSFSMLNRHISKFSKHTMAIIISGVAAMLFVSQTQWQAAFVPLAALFVFVAVIETAYFYRKG